MEAEFLPWPVGFELEFVDGREPGARQLDFMSDVERKLRDAGVSVHNHRGWRRTPPSLTEWDLKLDSSCGYELASPVIETRAELLSACFAVGALARSGIAGISSDCGFHVHVGVAAGMTPDALDRIIRFMWRYERAFYLMVPSSRRRNQYCRPISESVVEQVKRNSGDRIYRRGCNPL